MAHRTTPVSRQPYSAREAAAEIGLTVGEAALVRFAHGSTGQEAPEFHECSVKAIRLGTLRKGTGRPIGTDGAVLYNGFCRMPRRGVVAYHALAEAFPDVLRFTALHVLVAPVEDSEIAFEGACPALLYRGGAVRVSRELGYEGMMTRLFRDRGELVLRRDPIVTLGDRKLELPQGLVDRVNAFTGSRRELALT